MQVRNLYVQSIKEHETAYMQGPAKHVVNATLYGWLNAACWSTSYLFIQLTDPIMALCLKQ